MLTLTIINIEGASCGKKKVLYCFHNSGRSNRACKKIAIVLTLDGNSERIKEESIFFEKKIRFVAALDLIKCLKQIKCQRLFLACAPFSELQSSISTMLQAGYSLFSSDYIRSFLMSLRFIYQNRARLSYLSHRDRETETHDS